MSTSVSFPIAATVFVFPGSIEAPAGVFLAAGTIHFIEIQPDSAAAMLVEAFDAHDANGAPIGSTSRARYEIDVTGLAGLRNTTPNRFECYGTALGGGAAVGNYNRLFAATLKAGTDSQTWQLDTTFMNGMIVRVTPSAAVGGAPFITCAYTPRILGSERRKAKAKSWVTP